MNEPDPYRPAAFGADYQLTGFPRDEFGNLLYTTGKGEEYDAYIRWLADYLYDVEARPSPRQAALCEDYCTIAPAAAMGSLGMVVAGYQEDCEELRYAIEEVLGGAQTECTDAQIQAIQAQLAAWWEEQRSWDEDVEEPEGERLDPEDEELDDERTLPTPEDIRAVFREMRQLEESFAPEARQFLDLGWRVPLAQILQRVPAREERVRLLEAFFVSYREEAGK